MTAIELRTSIAADLEQMSLEMLENVSRYVKRLRRRPCASHYDEEPLKPYTMEEIDAMIDESEAEIAAGLGTPHEEVMREWDEEIARMEQEELEMAEVYENYLAFTGKKGQTASGRIYP